MQSVSLSVKVYWLSSDSISFWCSATRGISVAVSGNVDALCATDGFHRTNAANTARNPLRIRALIFGISRPPFAEETNPKGAGLFGLLLGMPGLCDEPQVGSARPW